MDVEAQTIKNTEDISKVTAAVSELTITMKFEMERGKEERESIKSMLSELKGINEKMGAIGNLQLKISELEGELGKQRHDIKNLENIQQAIPVFKEKLEDVGKKVAVLESREQSCKEWRDKYDGAKGAATIAVRALWAVFGTGIITIVAFVLYMFFTSQSPVLMRKIGSNTYYGQQVLPDEQR